MWSRWKHALFAETEKENSEQQKGDAVDEGMLCIEVTAAID